MDGINQGSTEKHGRPSDSESCFQQLEPGGEILTTHTTTHAALFDVDGIAPNPSWDARPLLTAAEVIIGHDVDTGDEFILFGRGIDVVWDTDVVVIELDVLQPNELAEVMAVVGIVRGRCDFDISDFKRHERIQGQ